MPLTTYAGNKMLDNVTGKTAFALPTTYIALYTTLPTSNVGTGGTEMTGGSYARTDIHTSWAAASANNTATNANIQVVCNTGTVVGFGVFDASTTGNLLFYEPLLATTTAESNVFPTSGEGINTITIDGTPPIRNVIVKDSTDTTTYTEGTDYTVEYQAGKVNRLAAGAIGSGATVHITYDTATTRGVLNNDILQFNSGQLAVTLKGYK